MKSVVGRNRGEHKTRQLGKLDRAQAHWKREGALGSTPVLQVTPSTSHKRTTYYEM